MGEQIRHFRKWEKWKGVWDKGLKKFAFCFFCCSTLHLGDQVNHKRMNRKCTKKFFVTDPVQPFWKLDGEGFKEFSGTFAWKMTEPPGRLFPRQTKKFFLSFVFFFEKDFGKLHSFVLFCKWFSFKKDERRIGFDRVSSKIYFEKKRKFTIND